MASYQKECKKKAAPSGQKRRGEGEGGGRGRTEDESDEEERWKRREGGVRGDRVPVCRAERCAVHHLQTGRQGCLGSLFLPRYKRSLDRLQQTGSTFSAGVLGQLPSRCDRLSHLTIHNHTHVHTNTLQVKACAASCVNFSFLYLLHIVSICTAETIYQSINPSINRK